jgi:hypothetical protein
MEDILCIGRYSGDKVAEMWEQVSPREDES